VAHHQQYIGPLTLEKGVERFLSITPGNQIFTNRIISSEYLEPTAFRIVF
jgi:hypothetical protein